MTDLKNSTVIVAGAGVFALACALEAARRGARVILAAPAGDPRRASAIAAGMLAPAMEAVLDLKMAGCFSLLREARDAWPKFAEGIDGLGLERCGAQLTGEAEQLDRVQTELTSAGAKTERNGAALFTPEDWRLEAPSALQAMERVLAGLGGILMDATVTSVGAREAAMSNGSVLEADAVVLATGWGALDLAPELAVLSPIKGQLLRYNGVGPSGGPILRGEGYVTPGRSGALAGASMEEGRADLTPDRAVSARLSAMAGSLVPSLRGVAAQTQVGVRPASPDGLPMAGRSETGAWIANGARRNGWLFAPLVARIVADGIAGVALDARFNPGRFSPA